MSQVTTLTFFRYQGFFNKVWAFGMMQFAHRHLKNLPGLRFYKLLGSGKGNGFNPWPDFSVYSILQVWENEQDAETFVRSHPLMNNYELHACERWSLFMKPLKVHGLWSGSNPFQLEEEMPEAAPHVAVITRATIRKKLLWRFWRYVPTSEKPLASSNGLLYTKGIGEVPFLQMATFSLWKNQTELKRFAYESREHAQAIKLTRTVKWYKEEMFVRFQPYKSAGSWHGQDPLLATKRLP